ncbi:DUF3040 domain-containing protein [Streptomyces atriruber]|uniref:DUF3040 domain-containing protein n=1 Tax=Streptomyces atriruber TaxID=545121 RepID=A0ABV3BFF6_9ACTN
MSTGRLPEHEQRILDEMELVLRQDRQLTARLWVLRLGPRARAALAGRPHPFTVAVFAAVSCTLLFIGIRTSSPGVVWAFALVWSLTLAGFVRVLCRWTEP